VNTFFEKNPPLFTSTFFWITLLPTALLNMFDTQLVMPSLLFC
jgi:hypothetical protein